MVRRCDSCLKIGECREVSEPNAPGERSIWECWECGFTDESGEEEDADSAAPPVDVFVDVEAMWTSTSKSRGALEAAFALEGAPAAASLPYTCNQENSLR